jgi:hypothetical protein
MTDLALAIHGSENRFSEESKMENRIEGYLFDHLLESLRRDLRREAQAQAQQRAGSTDWLLHGFNVHRNLQLLQLLNPKRTRLEQETDLQAKRSPVAALACSDDPSSS